MNAYVVEYRISQHKVVRLLVAAYYAGLAKEAVEEVMRPAGYAGGRVLGVGTAPPGAIAQLPLNGIDAARLFDVHGTMAEKLDC